MSDGLGDRMKAYEAVQRSYVMPRGIHCVRVDGRAFHSYLRKAEKPFDFAVMADMQAVGEGLCREISGAVFAYGQSDEISVIIQDTGVHSEPWFGGVVQKMVSVAASCCTGHLIARRGHNGLPQFDARVFTLPSWVEAANYIIWRQRDAVRNSVSMAAQARFSQKQLHGKTGPQMQEMLFTEHGINWSDYPDAAKRGWVLTREVRESEVQFVDKRTGEEQSAMAMRSFWELSSPHLTVESPLFALLRHADELPTIAAV